MRHWRCCNDTCDDACGYCRACLQQQSRCGRNHVSSANCGLASRLPWPLAPQALPSRMDATALWSLKPQRNATTAASFRGPLLRQNSALGKTQTADGLLTSVTLHAIFLIGSEKRCTRPAVAMARSQIPPAVSRLPQHETINYLHRCQRPAPGMPQCGLSIVQRRWAVLWRFE
jgi:hypothetical protein